MIINDPIFGELEYNYIWFKYIQIQFLNKTVEISLNIDGEESGKFDRQQYESYNFLMTDWKNIQYNILPSILNYYQEKRKDLGYDIEFNSFYPAIQTLEMLIENITFVGINIPYAGIFENRSIGLAFDCTWDQENGIGVRLLNEKIDKVGYHDITC
jgi:hypothetical protein